MLDEGVQIMRQLWTTGTATLDGKHYQVDGAIGQPLPLQDGGVPLWIAGGGEKKTLRIAAQYAQYTNFDGSPDAFTHKSEVLEAHCREVGTDYGSIVRSANYNLIIGETEKDVQDRIAWMQAHLAKCVPAEVARAGSAISPAAPGRHARADHRTAQSAQRAGHDLCDHQPSRSGLRPLHPHPVHGKGGPGPRDRLTSRASEPSAPSRRPGRAELGALRPARGHDRFCKNAITGQGNKSLVAGKYNYIGRITM